jgi:hypothetical protein
MICPKCGTEQPDQPECVRCGVLVAQYRGPALGVAALRPSAPPPASPTPAGDEALGTPPPPRFTGPSLGGTVGAVHAGALPETAALAPGAFKGTFGAGEILGETFSIYFSNFLPFALLTAVALSPVYLVTYFRITKAYEHAGLPVILVSALLLLVAVLLAPYIATGAITFGVFQQMRGQETSLAECVSRGTSLLLPVLGLAIVQAVGIGLGTLVLIIPGVILALRWAVAIPAAVTEGIGVSAALERSAYLTDGLRGDVFGVLLVLGVLQFGSAYLVKLAAPGNPSLHLLLSGVKDLLVVGLSATGSAVMYYRLRGVKESIDVDQIASVFA